LSSFFVYSREETQHISECLDEPCSVVNKLRWSKCVVDVFISQWVRRTEQNLTVRIVNMNVIMKDGRRSRYCTVEANYRQTQLRGLL